MKVLFSINAIALNNILGKLASYIRHKKVADYCKMQNSAKLCKAIWCDGDKAL